MAFSETYRNVRTSQYVAERKSSSASKHHPQELAEIRKSSGERVELIDVRTPIEFREVHVDFAHNVPLDRLDPRGIRAERAQTNRCMSFAVPAVAAARHGCLGCRRSACHPRAKGDLARTPGPHRCWLSRAARRGALISGSSVLHRSLGIHWRWTHVCWDHQHLRHGHDSGSYAVESSGQSICRNLLQGLSANYSLSRDAGNADRCVAVAPSAGSRIAGRVGLVMLVIAARMWLSAQKQEPAAVCVRRRRRRPVCGSEPQGNLNRHRAMLALTEARGDRNSYPSLCAITHAIGQLRTGIYHEKASWLESNGAF